MPESLPSINLIRNKQIPLLDKFMNWALTVGRLIVILTEIVAVLAFVYRFSLDEKLVDLHSAIKQKQTIILLLREDENRYRNLQDRIALASTTEKKTATTNKAVLDIMALVPLGVNINVLTLNKDRVNINIDATSISAFSAFINILKNYSDIKSINIDNIESKPSIGLLVTITIILK